MKFRPFLEDLKEAGELVETNEPISANLEAGAIMAKNVELDGPAIKFSNIPEYPGCSLVSGILASPSDMYPKRRKPWIRLSIGMGQDKDMALEQQQKLFGEAISQEGIKPLLVKTGPCKEVINKGKDVDIFAFPFPIIHERGGKRYGTMQTVIMEDPETGVVRWSDERFMLVSKNTLAINMPPDGFLYETYQKYEKVNKPMPVAIAIGVDAPVSIGTALYTERLALGGLIKDVPASDIAGYIGGEPIELVKAEESNLQVPAYSEMVIEGEIAPHERTEEGPFPNFYRYESVTPQPVLYIKTITHRKNPLIPFDVTGIKGSDSMTLRAVAHSFKLANVLNNWWWGARIVRWVYCPISMRLGLCIAAAHTIYPGFEYHFSRILQAYSKYFDKILFVDDALGGEELARVMQDFIQKASPVHAFHFTKEAAAVPKSAKYPTENNLTGRLYVNATFDPTWPKELLLTRVSFETTWPKAIQEKVLANWKRWGFVNEAQRRDISF